MKMKDALNENFIDLGNVKISFTNGTVIIKIANSKVEFNSEMWPSIRKYIDKNIKYD